MDLLTLFLFAIALCFDSFAVSVSCGLACCVWQRGRGIRFAVVLGAMQGMMLFMGWALAWNFREVIAAWDHWVAFVLLLSLGGKMIWGALRSGTADDDVLAQGDPFRFWRSVVLGFATSIDAVIAGASMAFLTIGIFHIVDQWLAMLLATGLVALVTFLASIVGLLLGRKSRGHIGSKAELIGGVVLVLIGVKVLIEHLVS